MSHEEQIFLERLIFIFGLVLPVTLIIATFIITGEVTLNQTAIDKLDKFFS